VERSASNTTTYYIWEGSEVIAEYTNGAPTGSGLKYYHPDLLSTRMSTSATGTVIGTQDNLPFGENGGASGNFLSSLPVGHREKKWFKSLDNHINLIYHMLS